MTRSCLCLSALAAGALLSGCLGTYTGRPEVRGSASIQPFSHVNRGLKAHAWEQVTLGAGSRTTTLGYLRVTSSEGRETRWVYDTEMRLLGWVSDTGRVFRSGARGDQALGHYDLARAMLQLFRMGMEKPQDVAFQPMPAPAG